MATRILMPQMGYDMKDGTVVKWIVSEGDTVSKGDIIAEIETDKAVVEMEAYASGILRKIIVPAGKSVPVGDIIAIIANSDEDLSEVDLEASNDVPSSDSETSSVVKTPDSKLVERDTQPQIVKATPIAKRLATEKGIDLTLVNGTGVNGRITEQDVVDYEATPSDVTGSDIYLSRMRQAIARITSQSKREIPHFYVTMEVDMDDAIEFRSQFNKAHESNTRLSLNSMIVKATGLTLLDFPELNGVFDDNRIHLNEDINIGIAVALDEGLVVPVINRCQDKSLIEISQVSGDLIKRAQGGLLHANEYGGSTFSISNLGMYDVDSFSAIIVPPNTAVLAVGAVKEKAVVKDGEFTTTHTAKFTISVDHRVADGAQGAKFLKAFRKYLETPSRLAN